MARLENLVGAFSLSVTDRLVGTSSAGMSPSEQASLVTLLAHPDIRVSWLGDVLRLTSSGATRLVDRLVDKGWVSRGSASDLRERSLRLTPAGRRHARAALRQRDDQVSASIATLSESERAQLEHLMERLVGNLTGSRLAALQTCRLCDRSACSSERAPCPLNHTVTADEPVD
jgi:DNA-binding MarR family transcriptional regulator